MLLLSRLDGIGDGASSGWSKWNYGHGTLGLAAVVSVGQDRIRPGPVEINTRHQFAEKRGKKMQRSESDTAPRHTARKPCAEKDPTEASLGYYLL